MQKVPEDFVWYFPGTKYGFYYKKSPGGTPTDTFRGESRPIKKNAIVSTTNMRKAAFSAVCITIRLQFPPGRRKDAGGSV